MAHKIVLNLNVFSKVPLYQQLADEIRKSIASGRLAAGERLPSIRALSRQLQIASTTVRQSLDLLAQEQIIILRPGSGAYVTQMTTALIAHPENAGSEDNRFTVPTFIGRYSELEPGIPWSKEAKRVTSVCNEYPFHPWWSLELDYDFRTIGDSAVDLLQGSRWQEMLTRWAKESMNVPTPYSRALGLPELRQEIALWLNRTQGMNCSADDLIITSGAQHARYLAAQVLVNPGATVVVPEPTSISSALIYESYNAHLLSVTQDQDGIDVQNLQKIEDASVAHLMTNADFPTGATLATERALGILDWAEKYNVAIVEDAFGVGYYYGDTPPLSLYSLARKQGHSDRIVYHGSLSQLLTPGLRLGFALIPQSLQKMYFRAQWLTERHPSGVMQELLIKLFSEGFFDEHILKVTQAARKRRSALLAALCQWPTDLISYTPVKAGFQQAFWFKRKVDDLLVFEKAIAAGIGTIPLSPYYRTESPKSGLSLNFLRLQEERILEGMEKLLPIVLSCVQESNCG